MDAPNFGSSGGAIISRQRDYLLWLPLTIDVGRTNATRLPLEPRTRGPYVNA